MNEPIGSEPPCSREPPSPAPGQQPYAIPGDVVMPKPTLHTIRVTTKSNVSVALTPRPNQLSINRSARDSVSRVGSVTYIMDGLMKANRTFDLIIAPNRVHRLNEPYFIRRRWDYFVQYLMGATPPDNYEITRPPDAAGGPVGVTPDDPSSWR